MMDELQWLEGQTPNTNANNGSYVAKGIKIVCHLVLVHIVQLNSKGNCMVPPSHRLFDPDN